MLKFIICRTGKPVVPGAYFKMQSKLAVLLEQKPICGAFDEMMEDMKWQSQVQGLPANENV
jgi:hypothetical protein